MSLQIAAQHLAARGRGEDSLLVHMTPREVAGLDALARRHYGRGLTQNPDTGLPEAGILGSLLPALAGVALSATGIGAPMAAMLVGGGTALATGSLQKGLMAGLGAWGGAGIGEGLMGMGGAAGGAAGSAASSATAANAPTAAISYTPTAGVGAAQGALNPAFDTLGSVADAGIQGSAFAQPSVQAPFEAATAQSFMPQTVTPMPDAAASMGSFDKMKAGLGALTDKGGFSNLVTQMGGPGQAMLKGGAALSPALAESMKPKIPQAPEDKSMIRPYDYDPLTQRYTAKTPVRAKDFPGFDDGGPVKYNYNPETQVFTKLSPTPAASAAPSTNAGSSTGPAGPNLMLQPPAPGSTDYWQYLQMANEDAMRYGRGAAGGAVSSRGTIGYAPGGIARLLQGPGDGVSDSIPAVIDGQQPAALADGEYVVPARVVSELGNGSTSAGARKLDEMVQRVQRMRSKNAGSKSRVAMRTPADRLLPA